MTRKEKRRRLTLKEEAELGGKGATNAAIRNAKKMNRPTKIGLPESHFNNKKQLKEQKSKSKKKRVRLSNIGFDKEIGVKRRPPNVQRREGTRAKKGDAIGSGKQKGSKKKQK